MHNDVDTALCSFQPIANSTSDCVATTTDSTVTATSTVSPSTDTLTVTVPPEGETYDYFKFILLVSLV